MDDQNEATVENPEAPLSSYLPPGYDLGSTGQELDVESPGWTFLTALRVTLGRPPLWLLTAMAPIAFALMMALPWHTWFEGSLGNSYAPGSQLESLDNTFRYDHADELSNLRSQSGSLAAGLSFLLMLVGVFTAGGWLQVFLERTEGHSVHRFFYGGSRYFWRFFRLLLLCLVLLGLGHFALYQDLWGAGMLERIFGVADGNLENVTSEASARKMTWTLDGLFLIWFGLVMVWADYTRTRAAFHGSRSMLWAGLATFFTLLVRPITTMRPMIGLLLCEVLGVVGLGYFSATLNHSFDSDSGTGRVGALFGISVIVILWRTVVRAARYHAAVQVTREIVEPLGVDDPWEGSIGGPGGPRYRVGDEELDYEVSI